MEVGRIESTGGEVGFTEKHRLSIWSSTREERTYGYIFGGFVDVVLTVHEIILFSVKSK